jgi:beta-glucanase (GH16 family)
MGNVDMSRIVSRVVAALVAASVLPGYAASLGTDTGWAVNVGGPAYTASDGTSYVAETSVEGGTVGRIEAIKGSQDPVLYKTYRVGDIRIEHPVANGTYDITFHFAEPETIERDERVFDAFVEGNRVIDDLDVMLFRDGKVRSALTVTVPDVDVSDGTLDVHFEASDMQPVLSALQIRKKTGRDASWELVWQDDFDGPDLDTANWSHRVWPPRKVNDEDQAYTARTKNVRVEDGHLVIEAHREDYQGAAYTSGRIHSSGKADFLYGRFEVRAKLPSGQGTWPAIWMLPSDPMVYATTCSNDADWQGSDDCDAWPNSGEIDIMEHVGYQMNHIHGTVHTRAYYWRMWEQRKGRILIDDAADAFHVYALEWSPERIDAFVDDSLYFTYVNERKSWREWPFDQPFHLILNIAVGGAWGRAGGPIDDTIFPQRMLIDYARVYRSAAAPD